MKICNVSFHLTSGRDIKVLSDLTSAAGGRDGGHVGEVLVLERRPGRDPVVGVVGQQAGQQLVPAQPQLRGQNLRGATIKVKAVVIISNSEWQPHLVGVGGRLPLGEHGLVVGEAGHPGPGLLGGRAEDPEYSDNKEYKEYLEVCCMFKLSSSSLPEELVNLRVPGEERLPRDHLREDAAQAPRVHAGRVELGS